MAQDKTTFWNRCSHAQKSLIGVGGLVSAGVVLIALMAAIKSEPEPKVVAESAPRRVEIMAVTPTTMRISVTSQGTVSPQISIKLISEVGGKVISVAEDYANGGFFSKENALVTIDDRDYQAVLIQAESDVAKAEELYALEKGRAKQAQREWRDLGDPEANELFLREPQLESSKLAVDAAIASRDRAQLNLERTRISVPFDGRIQEKHVDVGQYVSPGTVIAEVYSTEAVLIRLPLTDKQVAKVALPLTATSEQMELPDVVISSIYGGETYQWQARIVRTEAALDPNSRVTYAVAEISDPYENPTSTFRPPLTIGMYVSAEILGVEMENLVKIPRRVILQEKQVILVDDNNEIRFKTIEMIQNTGDEVVVSGLQKGERVLLTRVPFAVNGLKVDPGPEVAIADSPNTSEL